MAKKQKSMGKRLHIKKQKAEAAAAMHVKGAVAAEDVEVQLVHARTASQATPPKPAANAKGGVGGGRVDESSAIGL